MAGSPVLLPPPVAKLERLARTVSCVAGQMKRKVEFVACGIPCANRFARHIVAAVAGHEREMIADGAAVDAALRAHANPEAAPVRRLLNAVAVLHRRPCGGRDAAP